MLALIAQSVATCWTVRRSNPSGGEIFRSRPDRSWDPLSLVYSWYRVSSPGVKRSERGVNHPSQSIVQVKERVLLPSLRLHGLFQGENFYRSDSFVLTQVWMIC